MKKEHLHKCLFEKMCAQLYKIVTYYDSSQL